VFLCFEMNKQASRASSPDEKIHGRGLRMTDQRRAVYEVLTGKRDHPTAVEVFTRVRERMPSISLATVYNCLETLSDCGLAKTVTDERGPARYCPNLQEHAHFFCETCSAVSDIPLRSRRRPEDVWDFPENLTVSRHEIAFRGLCPKCAAAASGKAKAAKRN
jgi:Fur family peroxide stress response transcriptional regulator